MAYSAYDKLDVTPFPHNSLIGIAQPSVIQVSKKKPGDSCLPHRCGCNNCDLMKLIKDGCPNYRYTNSFPFLGGKKDRYTLEEQGEKMSREFDKIRHNFVSMMEEKVHLLSFQRVMTRITGFDSFKRNICTLHDRKEEIRSATHHYNLVDIIEDYITWFNCTLLKEIVYECVQIKELEKEDYDTFCKRFKQYEEARKSYCKRGIFECPSSLFLKNKKQLKPCTPSMRLFCLIVNDDKIKTIEHLDLFEGCLCSQLGVKRINFILYSIGKGCIELIYLLPSCVHEALFPLNKKQVQRLSMIGVTAICIGTSYESINTNNSGEYCKT